MDDASLKITLIGTGFVVGGLLFVIGLILRAFPQHRVDRARKTSIIGFIIGSVLLAVGILG